MEVKKYVVIREELARKIFKELGLVEGLGQQGRFLALTKLEEVIVKSLGLDKEG